jgi:hypothetical protein
MRFAAFLTESYGSVSRAINNRCWTSWIETKDLSHDEHC